MISVDTSAEYPKAEIWAWARGFCVL